MVELFAVLEFAALCGAAWYIVKLRRIADVLELDLDDSVELQDAVEALWYALFGLANIGGGFLEKSYNDVLGEGLIILLAILLGITANPAGSNLVD